MTLPHTAVSIISRHLRTRAVGVLAGVSTGIFCRTLSQKGLAAAASFTVAEGHRIAQP